jgi:type II secretory pathway pseudopilin PulG
MTDGTDRQAPLARVVLRRTVPDRAAFTLVEALVATALGCIVLAGILAFTQGARQMAQSGDLAGALQEAALAMLTIERDLLQAVQKPDPKVREVVMVTQKSVRMIRGRVKADGSIGGQLVVYRKEKTPAGNFRLLREEGGQQRRLPGLFRLAGFETLEGAGGPFVRVTLVVVSHDASPAANPSGSEQAILTSLVRVVGPESIDTEMFDWNFLDELKSVPFADDP